MRAWCNAGSMKWFWRKATESPADREWEEDVLPRVSADRMDRERRLAGQNDLVTSIENLLFVSDPIGINFEPNTNEYQAEAQTIAIRLPEAATTAELHRIVYEEFVHWFGDAGPEEQYAPIAAEIWALVHPGTDTAPLTPGRWRP